MNQYDIILPLLYFCIRLWCFSLALNGFRTRQVIFKRGLKGKRLKNSKTLMWAQIIGTFMLAVGLLIYAVLYASAVLQKLLLRG
jgi:hypothetical protein